jgi:2-polyprenyl-6-methoxyphenol hydroxylase-like FAD-dependent oxidoreductase
VRLRFLKELEEFEKSNSESPAPVRPKAHLDLCLNCKGSGLVSSASYALPDTENYPHVAIIGGGIGGVALAVACKHRGIPFTLYERDSSFDARSQGYGLTLQQASKAIEGFGVFSLDEGIISTKHVVHNTDGKVLGEWGVRRLGLSDEDSVPKRTNIHIARQLLRSALLEQLGGHASVKWGHQLIDLKECQSNMSGVDLSFQLVDEEGIQDDIKQTHADLVVGADGIRSSVRKLLIGEDAAPLRYLECLVILGICPLSDIQCDERTLLDSATVFQTANGNERIYIMPFTKDSIMWQLSFPMPEEDAKALSAQGSEALKKEALKRCPWHDPIPQIIAATQIAQVSGYPVYDRALLEPELLEKNEYVTLIGDAAHPMSPFKGQGANQALLDALSLARTITRECRPLSNWREAGIRARVLTEFETEMLQRSSKKVQESAAAAEFLHTDSVLHEGDEPRGRHLK